MLVLNSDLVVSEGLLALFLLEKWDPWWRRRRRSCISIWGRTVRQSIAKIRTSETSIIRSQTILHKLLKTGPTTAFARSTRGARITRENISVPFVFVLLAITRTRCVGSQGLAVVDLISERQRRAFPPSLMAFHERFVEEEPAW